MRLPISLLITFATTATAVFAQPVSQQEAKAAMDLYSQHKYAAAAASFEGLVRRAPNATYCYYAALAHRASGKELRARQLFEFIIKSYPSSQEATYAKQVIGTPAAAASNTKPEASSEELPESVRGLLSPEMQKALETPEGKRAVADVMKQNKANLATIRQAEEKGVFKPTKVAIAVPKKANAAPPTPNRSITPFTAADIAKFGSNAIDQMYYPNCWFESSMAAFADLPRGQRLLAGMIKGGPDAFVVRFPGDGNEYIVTLQELEEKGIHDSGLWASLLEAAQTQKFPEDNGNLLEVGLATLAGCKPEVLDDIPNCTPQQISSFVGGAVTSKNPIVASSWRYRYPGMLVEPTHAYTVIGFDPAHNMITIRNPHGKNGRRFSLESDPHHEDFQQLDNGVFKMSIRTFQKNFTRLVRAFI
jgi:hypothetical protein